MVRTYRQRQSAGSKSFAMTSQSQGHGQKLLVEALGDLVSELEAAPGPGVSKASTDQMDDAQFLLQKVVLKAQRVMSQLDSKSCQQLVQIDVKTNLKTLNHSPMQDFSELVNKVGVPQPDDSSSPSVGVAMLIPPKPKKCNKPKINSKQCAMLNHVVLSCVFKRMNAADLLHLRPVCKKWDLIIMETISNPANGKSLKAKLNDFNFHNLILSDLNQILGNSRKFPISTLQLNLDIWDWDSDSGRDVDISLFNDIHGAHIKTLIIEDCARSHQALNFLDLLTNQFRHVEHLVLKTMQNISVFDDWIEEIFTHMSLPSLKTLDFDGNEFFPFDMYMDLIRSAVNLECVTGQYPILFMALRFLHKGGLMKNARICTKTSNTGTVNFMLIAGLGDALKLTHLDIDGAPSPWLENFTDPLRQILKSSKITLESVRIPAFRLGRRKFTGITELPNLKRLHLYHPEPDPSESEGGDSGEGEEKQKEGMGLGPIFPAGTILANKFPQLNTLVLQLPVFSKRSMRKYFPGENYSNPLDKAIDVLPTLQNLELDCKMTIFGLKSLARKFPNVRSIKAKNIYDIFGEHDCRWYLPWANLEALELGGFRFDNDLCLDSFFTGFSEDICRNLVQLRKTGAGKKDLDVNMKILQTTGSLRDLQNLKKLKLVFDHESNSEWGAKVGQKVDVLDNDDEALITELTLEYAFNVMPKLHRVIIAYDHHRQNSAAVAAAFKPLTDLVFVTFDHEPLTQR